MKITIAYTPGEERDAAVIKAVVGGLCGPVKIRKSDRHPPFKHIYLTTTKSEKSSDSRTND